jgi:hypothetical protein
MCTYDYVNILWCKLVFMQMWLCVCVRTTPYEMLSDVIAYGLCHNNKWTLVYQFFRMIWWKKKISVVLALKKSGYYTSSTFSFYSKNCPNGYFQGDLIFLLFTKFDKTYTTMMAWYLTTHRYCSFRLIDTTTPRHCPKEANLGSL